MIMVVLMSLKQRYLIVYILINEQIYFWLYGTVIGWAWLIFQFCFPQWSKLLFNFRIYKSFQLYAILI